MPEMPVDKAYFTLAPDWACEILSPSTAAVDRGDKRTVYATEGVAHLWFVTAGEAPVETAALARALAEGCGARVVDVTPAAHDEIVAAISHLPQVMASVLMATPAIVLVMEAQ